VEKLIKMKQKKSDILKLHCDKCNKVIESSQNRIAVTLIKKDERGYLISNKKVETFHEECYRRIK